MLRPAAVIAAVLALAGAAQAADGDNARLAAALKKSMGATYHGYAFTKVTCSIPSDTATRAACKAHFTQSAKQLKGYFAIAVAIDRSTGGVRWHATKASCADLKSGAPVKC